MSAKAYFDCTKHDDGGMTMRVVAENGDTLSVQSVAPPAPTSPMRFDMSQYFAARRKLSAFVRRNNLSLFDPNEETNVQAEL